jgi:hypothetical protein
MVIDAVAAVLPREPMMRAFVVLRLKLRSKVAVQIVLDAVTQPLVFSHFIATAALPIAFGARMVAYNASS